MMAALLTWLSGFLPCRFIRGENGEPYLERYYVLGWSGFRVYLHRFVDDDPDRGLHDHPWGWAFSLILSGWYWEQRRDGVHRRRWVNWLRGDTFHRVVLPIDSAQKQPCWTLFVHGSRVKPWGFLRPTSSLSASPGAALWVPYTYPGGDEGEERRWWKHAPTGREARAQEGR